MALNDPGLQSLSSIAASEFYDVTITDTNSPIEQGDTLVVDYEVSNTGDKTGSQDITLEIDSVLEDTDAGVRVLANRTDSGTLEWVTDSGETAQDYTATVLSADESAAQTVTVEDAESAIPDSVVYQLKTPIDGLSDGDPVDTWPAEIGSPDGDGEDVVYREDAMAGNEAVEVSASSPRVEIGTADANVITQETLSWAFTISTTESDRAIMGADETPNDQFHRFDFNNNGSNVAEFNWRDENGNNMSFHGETTINDGEDYSVALVKRGDDPSDLEIWVGQAGSDINQETLTFVTDDADYATANVNDISNPFGLYSRTPDWDFPFDTSTQISQNELVNEAWTQEEIEDFHARALGDSGNENSLSTNNVTETGFNEITSQVSYTGTQGASMDSDTVWISAGQDDTAYLWQLSRSDLSYGSENTIDLTDELSEPDTIGFSSNVVQTSHHHNGTIYLFCREPEIHEIDASTLEYTDTSHYQVVPESEYVPDNALFEGITRYDGEAFSNVKWFVSEKCWDEDNEHAIHRLDGSFNHEQRYLIPDTNEDVRGTTNGYDGITVFDDGGQTFLVGSVTSGNTNYPALQVFKYIDAEDEWDFIAESVVDSDELKTADEGFQLDRGTMTAYAGLRHPYGDDNTDREVALSEQDWSDIIDD